MTNNDILRRLRFVFNINNAKMTRIFANVQFELPAADLLNLLKKEEEPDYKACNDVLMCCFLDGLIIENRGLKDGAEIPKPTALNNNLIFKKLRVALELKEDDIINLLALADFNLSKSELTALFRASGHKHFKTCGDQVLRNFIKGLSIKHRGK